MKNRASAVIISLFIGAVPTLAHASDYVGNEPRSLHHSLFDVREFRLQLRMIRKFPTMESGSILRTSPQAPVINASGSGTGELKVSDLSISERDTLRRQLRGGACPQHALPGYQKLCESLLKLQPVKPTQTGIKYEHRGFNVR